MFASATAMLALSWKRERDRAANLETKHAKLCLKTAFGLESVLRQPRPYPFNDDSRRFFDDGLSAFCLGEAIPVDHEDAMRCWHNRGDHECWRDAFSKLLARYREHERDLTAHVQR